MGHSILILHGSYRADRQGVRLAKWLLGAALERAFPRFADDLAW